LAQVENCDRFGNPGGGCCLPHRRWRDPTTRRTIAILLQFALTGE
jgi:hypothetical protein